MGCFREDYELSEPIRSNDDFDYFFFGLMIVISPAAAPLWYIGYVGAMIMGNDDE